MKPYIWERKTKPSEEEIQTAIKSENLKQTCAIAFTCIACFMSIFTILGLSFVVLGCTMIHKTYLEKNRLNDVYLKRYLEKRWLRNGKTVK